MKLLSFLQQNIWLSRRAFTALVDQGQIFCNWEKVDSYGFLVKEGNVLEIQSKRIVVTWDIQKSQLISFYKPAGCVASKSDPHNDTIYKHLPPQFAGYYYIWRLDKDSRGLLLLTNESKLVHEYEHPRHGMQKTYLVVLNKSLNSEHAQKCISGITDEDELLRMISVKNVRFSDYPSSYFPHEIEWFLVEVVLEEGKKRHIRRIFSAMRYHVVDLLRINEWPHTLGDLQEGQWKSLAI